MHSDVGCVMELMDVESTPDLNVESELNNYIQEMFCAVAAKNLISGTSHPSPQQVSPKYSESGFCRSVSETPATPC